MFSSDYKHFEKEFKTKFKVFSFSLVDRGSVIRIVEWRRNVKYSFTLDLGGSDWLRESVHNVLRFNPEEDFKRFYRTHNYRLILESARNKAGKFLKICKVQNGTLNHLFVPEESNWLGWRNFCYCLDSFFVIKLAQPIDNLGLVKEKQFQEGLKGRNKASKGERWDNDEARSVDQNPAEIKSPKQGWTGYEQQRKEWRKALVVYRYTMYLSWGEIRRRIQAKLRRYVSVVTLAADRAILWCLDEEEISVLLSNRFQFSNGRNQVKMERWNMFVHWENLQIQVNQSWMIIEGLPLNMWNIHVFKTIGKSLGGLLDVAPETKTLSFLKFAKIKVGGLEGGFMDPILEILCQGLKVSLGIFAISNPRIHSEGGNTFGLITRAIRAVEGSMGVGGIQKQARPEPPKAIQKAKPLFGMGCTQQDDVAVREGKKISVESYKEALLSAGSEKGGRKEVLGVSVDKRTLLAQREIDGKYGRAQFFRPKASVTVQYVNQGQRGRGSLYAGTCSNFNTDGDLGQTNRCQKNKGVSEVGQAHKVSQGRLKIMGLNEARWEKKACYYSLRSAQAHYRHKGE